MAPSDRAPSRPTSTTTRTPRPSSTVVPLRGPCARPLASMAALPPDGMLKATGVGATKWDRVLTKADLEAFLAVPGVGAAAL